MAFADGILPAATWVANDHNAGLSYVVGPSTRWKIVLHEIQGDDRLDMIRSHPSPPQLWYDPVSRELHQTIPLTRAGYALFHYGARPETNRALAIQVELAGFSSPLPDEPQSVLDNIAHDVIVPICQFVDGQGGQIDLTQVSGPFVYPGSALETAAQRLSDAAFQAFGGLTAHGYAPQNEHWDVGGMDLKYIAEHARLVVAGELAKVVTDVAEAPFRLRPVPFDDVGIPGSADTAYDHPWLPAGATVVVANRNPDAPAFFSVIYGPGFNRNDLTGVVRSVRFGAPVSYVTKQAGMFTIVTDASAPADVFAVY